MYKYRGGTMTNSKLFFWAHFFFILVQVMPTVAWNPFITTDFLRKPKLTTVESMLCLMLNIYCGFSSFLRKCSNIGNIAASCFSRTQVLLTLCQLYTTVQIEVSHLRVYFCFNFSCRLAVFQTYLQTASEDWSQEVNWNVEFFSIEDFFKDN